MRLDRLFYSISHAPGKQLYTADTLPRAPRKKCSNDVKLETEIESLMELCKKSLPASAKTLDDYQVSKSKDAVCCKVIDLYKEGCPERSHLEPSLISHWKVRGELTVSNDGLLLYSKIIVVPKVL